MAGTIKVALAGAGALNALAGHRREALWQVAAVHEDDELFRHAGTEDAAPAPLAPMTPLERVQQDFLLTGLTTGRHPLALLRDRLPGRRAQRIRDAEHGDRPVVRRVDQADTGVGPAPRGVVEIVWQHAVLLEPRT